jgi:hypothetical protein
LTKQAPDTYEDSPSQETTISPAEETNKQEISSQKEQRIGHVLPGEYQLATDWDCRAKAHPP